MKRVWRKAKVIVWDRKVPFAMLHWRFLLPGQSIEIRLHRRAFLQALPQVPRLVWFCIALFSFTRWYLWFGPRQLIRVWQQRKVELCDREGITPLNQLQSLLQLVYVFAIPPVFYYRYRLHMYPASAWFKFIYSHELPSWHWMFSESVSDASLLLVDDKRHLADCAGAAGLPVVPHLFLSRTSGALADDLLFQGKSLFLKPRRGARKEGACALLFEDNAYTLVRGSDQVVEGMGAIRAELARLVSTKDYLVQPLLINHPELNCLCFSETLITFRVITAMLSEPVVISANMEFPAGAGVSSVIPVSVEPREGAFLRLHERLARASERAAALSSLATKTVPLWHELKRTVCRAHETMPDITTVGWDCAITPNGVVLIEGNMNWGVDLHQLYGPNLMPHFTALVAGES